MSAATPVPCRAISLRQSRGLSSLCTILSLLLGSLAVLAAFGSPVICVLFLVSAAALGFAARRIATRNRRVDGGNVALVDGGIELRMGGRSPVVIAPTDVVRGYELETGDGIGLDLTRRRDVELLLPSGASVSHRALLSHLRVSVDDRPFVASLVSAMPLFAIALSIVSVVVLPFVFAVGGAAGAIAVAAFAAAFLLARRRFGAPKVHVGRDGIRVTGTWTEPFVPYRDIRGVRLYGRGVLVLLDEDHVLQLDALPSERTLLRGEIQKALDAHNSRGGPAVGVLARQGRALRVWQEDLQRLAVGSPGFRTQAWSREDLERVLDDASASPEQRVGAALAIRADPDARVRIRVAASASANEELRAALDACAAEDEAIDETALEGITERAE